jgi:hypothetical protein
MAFYAIAESVYSSKKNDGLVKAVFWQALVEHFGKQRFDRGVR